MPRVLSNLLAKRWRWGELLVVLGAQVP